MVDERDVLVVWRDVEDCWFWNNLLVKVCIWTYLFLNYPLNLYISDDKLFNWSFDSFTYCVNLSISPFIYYFSPILINLYCSKVYFCYLSDSMTLSFYCIKLLSRVKVSFCFSSAYDYVCLIISSLSFSCYLSWVIVWEFSFRFDYSYES